MPCNKVQFDNSDRKIPVDSDMVTVTREMNDKGESEYYLESKKINRNRILDIFDMANAGPVSYTHLTLPTTPYV